MLKKLMKHEWRACARICLPLYGAAILLALMGRIFIALNPALRNFFLYQLMGIIGGFLYCSVMVAVFVVTLVILVMRFYKNLLGNEGYLMFTLPVTVSQHIWTKAIVALLMSALSMAAAVLSVMIMAFGIQMPKELAEVFSSIGNVGFNGILTILETLLFFLIATLAETLFIYLCIALGHLSKKHREVMAVVWYFALSVASQFVFAIFMNIVSRTPLWNIVHWIADLQYPAAAHITLIGLCVVSAIITAICFVGTKYILKNKLNLE